jgi:hypothetical protein
MRCSTALLTFMVAASTQLAATVGAVAAGAIYPCALRMGPGDGAKCGHRRGLAVGGVLPVRIYIFTRTLSPTSGQRSASHVEHKPHGKSSAGSLIPHPSHTSSLVLTRFGLPARRSSAFFTPGCVMPTYRAILSCVQPWPRSLVISWSRSTWVSPEVVNRASRSIAAIHETVTATEGN